MIKTMTALVLILLVNPILLFAPAQAANTEPEAQSVAVDAYIYFYPLVTMDVTRKQLTNVAPGKGARWTDEYVLQRSNVSPCGYQGSRSAQFRYAVLHFVSGPH